MATSDQHRKLTAILSADVAGYSRLMGIDEAETLRHLTASREVFAQHIERHHGRVVNAPGDALLADFGSVVDAVTCAVEIQDALAERNAALSEERQMRFRIGVNLGDVLVQDDDIYGDGVNIAARLESLAEPGGICISGTAFDQVDGKLLLRFEFQGEQKVKNIAKPVRTYRVRADADDGTQPRPELPGQPSIAVLAFDNLSGDPDQSYFSDGISENIITGLAAIPDLMVAARNSSFVYKGKAVDVRKIGSELGVRYVLEGSVLRASRRIRVTAQLIDAETGKHLWAERYDRELSDLLAVMDDITMQVVTQLEVRLTLGDHARVISRGTRSVEALECQMRARALFMRFDAESNRRARELSRQATELDPTFGWAFAQEGWTYVTDLLYGWSQDAAASLRQAELLARKAQEADPTNQFAYTLLSRLHALKGELDQAIAAGRRAVELSPNDAYPLALLAHALIWDLRPEESEPLVRKAMSLQPYPDIFMFFVAGYSDYLLGHYEEASAWCRKGIERQQSGQLCFQCWQFLIASLVELGQLDAARSERRAFLAAFPDISIAAIERFFRAQPSRDHAFLERFLPALRKSGLPE